MVEVYKYYKDLVCIRNHSWNDCKYQLNIGDTYNSFIYKNYDGMYCLCVNTPDTMIYNVDPNYFVLKSEIRDRKINDLLNIKNEERYLNKELKDILYSLNKKTNRKRRIKKWIYRVINFTIVFGIVYWTLH